MSTRRRRRPWLAALLLSALAGGLMYAWWAANDGYVCERIGVADCTGPGLLLALVGVPITLVLSVICFRLSGAASGVVGLLFVMGPAWALALLTEPLEPPQAVWAFVVGALASTYVAMERRFVDHPGSPDDSGSGDSTSRTAQPGERS